MVRLNRKMKTTIPLIALLMSSLFGLFAPVPVVNATSTVLSVGVTDPAVSNGVVAVDSFFDVFLDVTDIQDLAAYDIALSFDETQLEYLGSTVLSPWTTLRLDQLPGSIRVAAGIFAGSIDVPAESSEILVVHTFQLVVAGRSLLHISQSTLGVAGAGAALHTAVDGEVKSEDNAPVRLFNARPARDAVRLRLGESSMDLVTRVSNDGTTDVMAFLSYRVISTTGTVFGFTSPTFSLPASPGSRVDITVAFVVEARPDTFFGTIALLVSEDGGMSFSVADARQLNHPFTVEV